MVMDIAYKQKLSTLKEWMPSIVEIIKGDLKNDHLRQDASFLKKYFSSQNINKLTIEEFSNGYNKAIEQEEKGEEIAEFIANRWLLKNNDLYQCFEEELQKITPDFTQLELLEDSQSRTILEKAVPSFGAIRTYLFSVLNGVVFSPVILEELHEEAQGERNREFAAQEAEEEQSSLESLQKNYEQKIVRLVDKYEKKLSGLEKRYHQDVGALKKQLATLQRRLEQHGK